MSLDTEAEPHSRRPRRFTALLQGGLGNQMFQYAMARSMCLKHNAQLVLDTRSGFWLDRQYKRSYELGRLNPRAEVAGFADPLRWIGTRAACKVLRHFRLDAHSRLERRLGYFREPSSRCVAALPELATRDWTFVGYWQSPRYFDEYETLIRQELFPPEPSSREILSLGQHLRDSETIAIGFRLYEESTVPNAHASDGRLKTLSDLAGVVRQILLARPSARCVIFCTHTPVGLAECGLPSETTLIVPERIDLSPLENLWLLTQCEHHVFSNSTFYWWGAWLSQALRSESKSAQSIFAANNFQNRDCVPPTWNTF
jgi:hypothetical protein